jgi:hypothetical protein
MENRTELETERWVEEKMALLAAPPDWEPDAGVAQAGLQGRLSARRPILARVGMFRAATVALACLVLFFSIPTTRALTQQLWQWLTVQQVEVVQVDFERLRGPWLLPQISMAEGELDGGGLPAPEELDFADALRRLGFTPRLPHEGVPPIAPYPTIMDPMVWSATLRAADLESSLRQAGVDDQPIPQEWDGARLSIHIGPALSLAWEGEVALVQHRPVTLSAPPGFDFAAYWTAALRAGGVDRERAQQLGERMATAPTLLFGIGARDGVAIREVTLRSGPGTLIEHMGQRGEVTLMWSAADRAYTLMAKSDEQAILIANSVQ